MKLNKNEEISLKYIKNKIKKNVFLSKKEFTPGNMLFYSYNPKDTDSPYDKNPLILVIKVTAKHILGINFHWAPLNMRKKILKIFLSKNKDNIKRQNPLSINDAMSKEMYRMCRPIFRLYIKKRISRRGALIPHTEMGYVINLRAEHFIGISAEDAWKYSIMRLLKKRNKNGKSNTPHKT